MIPKGQENWLPEAAIFAKCRMIFISNFSDILFARKLKMPAFFQPSALKEPKGKIQLYSLVWQPMLLAVMTPLSIWKEKCFIS